MPPMISMVDDDPPESTSRRGGASAGQLAAQLLADGISVMLLQSTRSRRWDQLVEMLYSHNWFLVFSGRPHVAFALVATAEQFGSRSSLLIRSLMSANRWFS